MASPYKQLFEEVVRRRSRRLVALAAATAITLAAVSALAMWAFT